MNICAKFYHLTICRSDVFGKQTHRHIITFIYIQMIYLYRYKNKFITDETIQPTKFLTDEFFSFNCFLAKYLPYRRKMAILMPTLPPSRCTSFPRSFSSVYRWPTSKMSYYIVKKVFCHIFVSLPYIGVGSGFRGLILVYFYISGTICLFLYFRCKFLLSLGRPQLIISFWSPTDPNYAPDRSKKKKISSFFFRPTQEFFVKISKKY